MAIGDDISFDLANKSIDYTGGSSGGTFDKPTNIYSVRELYQFVQGEFDEPDKMDDAVPMSAQTPNEYTMINGWHIRERAIKALFGGSVQTTGWKRIVSTDAGIVIVPYSGTPDPVLSDIGKTITHDTDGDVGVLLDFDTVRNVLWIRPNSSAAADNFDSASGNLDVTAGTQNIVQTAAAATGETVFHNIFSLGTIETQSEIYVIQTNDFFEVSAPVPTKLKQWWDEDVSFVDPTGSGGAAVGHIDLLVKIKEVDVLIDKGNLTVNIRQYSKAFDHFITIPTGAGRSPIPLSTADDLNNTSGYRQFITNAAVGTWDQTDIGKVFRESGVNDNTAVMTSLSGTSPNFTIQYYLIGTLEGFLASDVVEDEPTGVKTLTLTASAPTNVNSALAGGVTITHGHDQTLDIDDDGSVENYSVVIDANSTTLASVYERLKFLTRRGQTADIDDGSQTITGEDYLGIGSVLVDYDAEGGSGPPTEGETVTVVASGFTGIMTSVDDNGTSGTVVIRNIRGSIANNDVIEATAASARNVTASAAGVVIAPTKAAPFGTFAGGKFFGARGVGIKSVPAADAQNYQTTDTQGNVIVPPNIVGVKITNLVVGDRVAVFRLTGAGGTIDKAVLTSAASGNNAGDTTLDVTTTISKEFPSSGGTARVVDDADSLEQRYSYASFATTIFTLVNIPTGNPTSAQGAGATLLIDTGATFQASGVTVGMTVRNATDGGVGVVVSVDSEIQITHTPLTGGTNDDWEVTDVYELNRLIRTYTSADSVYPAIIDEDITSGSDFESSITYTGPDFSVTIRVRKSSGGTKILPFVTEGLVNNTGLTVAAIRTTDTIATT